MASHTLALSRVILLYVMVGVLLMIYVMVWVLSGMYVLGESLVVLVVM